MIYEHTDTLRLNAPARGARALPVSTDDEDRNTLPTTLGAAGSKRYFHGYRYDPGEALKTGKYLLTEPQTVSG